MKKGENIKSYSASALRTKQKTSGTRLKKIDALSDKQLEKKIAAEGLDFQVDWSRAKLVFPHAKKSVHLRLEEEVISFFKEKGAGHISLMQAVLKSYAKAHSSHAK